MSQKECRPVWTTVVETADRFQDRIFRPDRRVSSDGLEDKALDEQNPGQELPATLDEIDDDCEDKLLDAQIQTHIARSVKRGYPVTPCILDTCAELSPNLEATAEDIDALLVKYPQLEAMAQNAMAESNFSSIRRLVALQKIRPINIPKKSSMASREVRRQLGALEEAWAREYVGNGQQLLLHTINNMNTERKRVPHDNYMAIIQSSGTGKSRTVHEMAKLVFTIPMNVRSEEAEIDHPYPSTDKALRNYLLMKDGIKTENDLAEHFLKFLGHLCDCIVEELETEEFQTCLKLTSSTDMPRMERVAQVWFNHLESENPEIRKKLFKKAVSHCSSEPPSGPEKSMELVADRERQSSGSLPTVTATKATKATRAKNPKAILEQRVTKSLQRLIQKVKTLAKSVKSTYVEPEGTLKVAQNPVTIVFYMDEAQTLTAKQLPSSSRSYYDVFCSTCTTFTALDVFFLYLSTDCSLRSFAPYRGVGSSARVVEGGTNSIQAPYTEIATFDCFFGRDLRTKLSIQNTRNSESKTLTQASDWRFLAMFGRPLFGSSVNTSSEDELILKARMKLLCRSDPNDTVMRDTVSGSLALFGVRILLKFDVTREQGRQGMLDLVKSHMAIAFSVPNHREYIHMGYPSEPVLAEAAAHHLHFLRTKKNFIPIAEVLDLLRNGYADKGEVGELVARLLFTMAYDDAIREHQKGESNFNYSKGVPLETFIYALFTKDHADKIMNSVPDNVSNGTIFRKAFKNFWVRFTHFGRGEGADFVNSVAACVSFARCMAIQCWGPHKSIDVILPLLKRYSAPAALARSAGPAATTADEPLNAVDTMDSDGSMEQEQEGAEEEEEEDKQEEQEEQHLCEQNMSQLMTLVKNRIEFQTKSRTAFTAEKLETFPRKGPRVPYIALQMNLGADVEKDEVLQVGSALVRQSPRLAKDTLAHPRYTIHAFGCRSELYKVVNEYEEHFFLDVLRFEPPLVDHPRKDPGSLGAVKIYKPYWNLEKPYCDWVNGVLPAGN